MSRQKVAKWIRNTLPKKCVNCGSTRSIGFHHIVPVECGGNDVPSNVAVLCSKCHGAVHYGNGGVVDHGELVRKGMEAARMQGRVPGRKPANYEAVMRLIAENSTQFNPFSMTTEEEIMQMAGVKSVCYAKCKRMLIEAISADVWNFDWKKPKMIQARPTYAHVLKKIRGW